MKNESNGSADYENQLETKIKRLEAQIQNRGFRFQPSISFDGVAIVIACILSAIAWGHVTTVVEQHSMDINSLKVTTAEHTISITELKERTAHNNR